MGRDPSHQGFKVPAGPCFPFGQQRRHGAAQQFPGRIAEKPQAVFVDEADDAITVPAQDGELFFKGSGPRRA